MTLISYLIEAACREFNVRFSSLPSFLLEAMKDIDSLRTRSQIDHAKGPRSIPYTYFLDSSADGLHGLPVRRLEATLHKIQIESSIPSRFVRKGLQIIMAGANEMQRLACHLHSTQYTDTNIFIQLLVLRREWIGNQSAGPPPCSAGG